MNAGEKHSSLPRLRVASRPVASVTSKKSFRASAVGCRSRGSNKYFLLNMAGTVKLFTVVIYAELLGLVIWPLVFISILV